MLYPGLGDPIRHRCPSAELLWAASRSLAGVQWQWDVANSRWETFTYTRDARYEGVAEWDAGNGLSSLLRAVREDERLDDPLIRLIAFYITAEYLATVKLP